MAHFALLNNTNIVVNVVVLDTDAILDENGIESEEIGQRILHRITGRNDTWKKTSYNTRANVYYEGDGITPHQDQSKAFRKNFAGIGFEYHEDIDAFVPPRHFPSMVLNTSTGLYEYPIPYPADAPDEEMYIWNEEQQRWDIQPGYNLPTE